MCCQKSCQKSSLITATQSFLRHTHFLLYSPPSHQRLLACFGILVSHHWRPLQTPSLVLQPRRQTMHLPASGLYALLPCRIGPHLELDVNTLLRPSVMLTRTSIESCFWNNIKVIHVKVEQIQFLKEEEIRPLETVHLSVQLFYQGDISRYGLDPKVFFRARVKGKTVSDLLALWVCPVETINLCTW